MRELRVEKVDLVAELPFSVDAVCDFMQVVGL
jgi:hypothetical protein